MGGHNRIIYKGMYGKIKKHILGDELLIVCEDGLERIVHVSEVKNTYVHKDKEKKMIIRIIEQQKRSIETFLYYNNI